MCGSSQAMNQVNQSQTALFSQLINQLGGEFGAASSIFNELQSSLAPIVAAGVNQQGFSAAELASMNTQAIQNAGNTYAQESQAANEAMAARGGGNIALPSGAQSQVQEEIGTAAENQKSSALEKITQENYATGRQNYFNALGALSAAPGVFGTANQAANAATGAGGSAMQGATQIQQANNSWMGLLGGILGNAAQVGEGFATGGLSFGGGGGGGELSTGLGAGPEGFEG